MISGLVVLLTTGSLTDTLKTYRAIFRGAGLNWFFHVGSYSIGVPFGSGRVWFPWNTDDITSQAASNLEQTLILWTALALTGLAVAFAFRCGLFNIGGNGQYLTGSIAAVLIATDLASRGIDVADISHIAARDNYSECAQDECAPAEPLGIDLDAHRSGSLHRQLGDHGAGAGSARGRVRLGVRRIRCRR